MIYSEVNNVGTHEINLLDLAILGLWLGITLYLAARWSSRNGR